ncbi:hypothetical protein BUALT_Bualt01G0083200 [Buddleja alternifolia]|uniref:RRM domain-containing protein n=1 Tax=Buddleja alternifolia TaxID=168488 RepID=A0AAV6YC17_9LAMI|nr:hypothetical protein BUALT_Bualt01G0083200 [Buddleja alternifolia]
MADAYWRYGQGRQQQAALHPHGAKRPRSNFEIPSGPDMSSYYAREGDRAGLHVSRDANSVNPLYDTTQMSPGLGGHHHVTDPRVMAMGGHHHVTDPRVMAMGGHHHVTDPRVMAMGGSDPALAARRPPIGVGGRSEISLPPDASPTLFMEGLPANCSRREVSHIFRPFVGYKEARLVTKESRHSGGEPLVLCFVDFQSPAHAATAMDALQGKINPCFDIICSIKAFVAQTGISSFHHLCYKFDEHERDSAHLRLQFARYPGARSGGGHRGKR